MPDITRGAERIGESVLVVIAWGIYKDYDGNAPDSQHMFFTTNKQVADFIVDKLNKLHGQGEEGEDSAPRDLVLAACEGWEWSASWTKGPAYCTPDDLINTIDLARDKLFEALDYMNSEEESQALKARLQ